MKLSFKIFLISGFMVLSVTCVNREGKQNQLNPKIPVIFDTDANNELDDQHALAYLLFNGNTFNVKGVTVNATFSGGDIEAHYNEAKRIIKLCSLNNRIPLFRGANSTFDVIKDHTDKTKFDGSDAVNFIIETVKSNKSGDKLVIIAVGKLTNVALTFKKEPLIAKHVKLVWLGSNYPEPGEYNQDNDTASMNYILKMDVLFEMVTVRYGQSSGTDAVKITRAEVNKNMPGKGPEISSSVKGRHGGSFNNFGDYSVDLFKHIDYYGDPPSRALFDMAAVAIVKNPEWAESSIIPCPVLIDNKWHEQPENPRKIVVWENFDREKILNDFYNTLDNYVLVNGN